MKHIKNIKKLYIIKYVNEMIINTYKIHNEKQTKEPSVKTDKTNDSQTCKIFRQFPAHLNRPRNNCVCVSRSCLLHLVNFVQRKVTGV